MADKKGAPKADQGQSNVVAMDKCPVEKCGKKSARLGFCAEHFTWFKEGLVGRDGHKPKDFDKKYQAYMNRQKPAA